VNRRRLVTLFASAMVCPFAASAQQTGPPVVGILDTSGTNAASSFREGLSEGGFVEGHSVVLEHRPTENYA
jgi:hypothetical protein